MLKINKKVEYALISLKHISQNQGLGLSSAKEISSRFSIPFDATSKVLQALASHKWLKSEQGSAGGYTFGERKIEDLSLIDLVEIIEGPQNVVKCLSSGTGCPSLSKCNMVSPMEKLNEGLRVFLKEQKVMPLLQTNQEMRAGND